ncbi:hypothetical protein [Paenibacillus wenxiniae]|uniref:Uncharacterized protein n=1 Tax=Paenibacillus wenxiniae TaxID=1636843 RepID=A0ABW4RP72_9BACL
MIKPTEQLIHLLRSEKFHSEKPIDSTIIQSYCDVIAQYGDREDAAMLLQWYMNHSGDGQYNHLLHVVMRCGDLELAAKLYQYHFNHEGELGDDAPDGVLHILAYMGYPLHTEYLVKCVLLDHRCGSDACLALLHMPYTDHHRQLIERFDQLYGDALFPEFLPALGVKWATAGEMVPKLVAWGKQASIDCNGGLLFGIAMYGPTQKEQIKQILWDPDWELYSNGTGGHWWAYMAMPLVELTFAELIRDVKMTFGSDPKRNDEVNGREADHLSDALQRSAEHCFDVLHSLLQLKLERLSHPLRYVNANAEAMMDLYPQLFAWSTPYVDDSILGVIADTLGVHHRLTSQFHHVRAMMELAVRHEIEMSVG